jgi:aryl-alcohol dehydrogenase
MKIRAAIARATGTPLSLETVDLEDPRDDEILVRLVAVGICHTDIAMRDQVFPVPQPVVLGHEGAGVVEHVGKSVTGVAPGDHVLMSYNSCGACASCLEHEPAYCHDFFDRNFAGTRADGSSALSMGGSAIHGNFFGQSSFATHALCRERNVVKVPSDVPLDIIAPLACGIQTGAGSVINALQVGVGDSIAVFGTGSVGLSAVLAARLTGAGTIIGVDLNHDRLQMAQEFGATHIVDAGRENVVEAIKAATGGGANFTLETTAVPAVVRQAVDVLAARGTCGILGASAPGTEVSIDLIHVMTGGRTFRGIVEGESNPKVFIPTLIQLYRQGRFPFDRMITFYDFEQINDAIADSEHGKCIKPVIRFGPA